MERFASRSCVGRGRAGCTASIFRCVPNSGAQRRPNSRQNSAEIATCLTEFGPTSVETGPNSAEISSPLHHARKHARAGTSAGLGDAASTKEPLRDAWGLKRVPRSRDRAPLPQFIRRRIGGSSPKPPVYAGIDRISLPRATIGELLPISAQVAPNPPRAWLSKRETLCAATFRGVTARERPLGICPETGQHAPTKPGRPEHQDFLTHLPMTPRIIACHGEGTRSSPLAVRNPATPEIHLASRRASNVATATEGAHNPPS